MSKLPKQMEDQLIAESRASLRGRSPSCLLVPRYGIAGIPARSQAADQGDPRQSRGAGGSGVCRRDSRLAERLTRGTIVIASAPGEYGKPRPAVVVQRNFDEALDSIVVCPMTSTLIPPGPLRPTIEPSAVNGLRHRSQVMVDKLTAVQVRRLGEIVAARCLQTT